MWTKLVHKCKDTEGSYECECHSGWEKKENEKNCTVNINECNENPCENGECKDTEGSYECECQAGWEKYENGKNCTKNINECLADPCGNGDCTDTDGAFNCTCHEGWGPIGNETCGNQFKFGKL